MNIFNKTPKPVHDLHKQPEVTPIDKKLTAISPFVIFVMIFILMVLGILAFGHVFATEANMYYYHMGGL